MFLGILQAHIDPNLNFLELSERSKYFFLHSFAETENTLAALLFFLVI